MTGKNMPSRLKSLKDPFTLTPLKVKDMHGSVRSRATPITSPFLIKGSVMPSIAGIHLPPKK